MARVDGVTLAKLTLLASSVSLLFRDIVICDLDARVYFAALWRLLELPPRVRTNKSFIIGR